MANVLAYGFAQYAHLAAQRVTTVGEKVVYDLITEAAKIHTDKLNALMGAFVEITDMFKERWYLGTGGTLQPLDENGKPLPVRPGGYYDIALPIQGGGTGWAKNRVAAALMTIAEASRATTDNIGRDQDWMRRHILAALLDNTSWAYADPLHGSLTVQPLANNDAVVHMLMDGSTAADNHYLAQAAAISDAANPFGTIYTELMEHPTNQLPVVAFVPSALTTSIEALTGFVAVNDPDITPGNASDQITASNLEAIRGFGSQVLGKVDKCWIVEWRSLPATHIVAHAVGAGSVLGMRQYPAPELQGFFTENEDPGGGLQKANMIRYAGFGVLNRIAACVQYIGDGAYAIPTGYETPLAA